MRYATVVITPDDGGFHPADAVLWRDPEVRRESIQQINLLTDDTAVTLYELRGDLARAAALLQDVDSVLSCDVSGDREGLAYVHLVANETVRRLLSIVQEQEVVLNTPLGALDDGGVRVTIVGEDEPIRRAVDGVPDDVTVTLESIGDYHPETDHLFSTLTHRQQEILESAVELGYYEVPRDATHADIATAVGLTAGTVGEHLRKVEGKVFSALVSR